LIVGYGFFGFGYVIAATFVVAIAAGIEAGGIEAANFDARSVWVVVGLALVPSVYVWQWLANNFGLVHTLCAAYLVESAGVLMAGLSDSYWWLVVACVLLGGTFAAITALGLSAARDAAPHRIAFAVGAMTVAFAVGQLLGPAVAGRMADMSGDFVWSSVVAAVLLATAAMLALKTTANR
jgi:MFS family permease